MSRLLLAGMATTDRNQGLMLAALLAVVTLSQGVIEWMI